MTLYSYGLKSAPTLSGVRLTPAPPPRSRAEKHALYGFVGPPGTGKSLLAVHFCRAYGRERKAGELCLCGEPGCESPKWRVLSNIPSTYTENNPKGIAWAEHLDVTETLMDRASELGHVIVLADETHMYADSRRSSSNANLGVTRFIAQRRKLGGGVTKVFFIAQSFDMLDTRIRAQCTRVFDCWTPNEGVNVGAVIHDLALAHLPPWRRRRGRPRVRMYPTMYSRDWYDTHDQVDSDELNSRDVELSVWVKGPDGRTEAVYLSEMVGEVLYDAVGTGMPMVTAEAVKVKVEAHYGIPVPLRQVRNLIRDFGYATTTTDTGETAFFLVVDRSGSEGELSL